MDDLKKGESKSNKLFNNISDMVFLRYINNDGSLGSYLEVNDAACRILGYTYEEFLKMSPKDTTNNKKLCTCAMNLEELIKEKNSIFKTLYISKSGKEIQVEVNAQILDCDNSTMCLCVSRNITERGKYEEESNREHIRTRIENLVNISVNKHNTCKELFKIIHKETDLLSKLFAENIYITKQNFNCMQRETLHIESIFAKMYAGVFRNIKDPQSVISLAEKNIFTRIFDRGKPVVITSREDIDDLLNFFTSDNSMARRLTKSSEISKIRSIVYIPLIWGNKKFGMIEFLSTESINKEDLKNLIFIVELLREAIQSKISGSIFHLEHHAFPSVLGDISDAVIITDISGYIKCMNGLAQTMTSHEFENVQGLSFDKVFNVIDHSSGNKVKYAFEKICNTGRYFIDSKNGRLTIDMKVNAITGKKQETQGFLIIITDITEIEKVESKRFQTKKLESLKLFAGGLAHDFNNLLAIIQGNLSLAKSSGELDEYIRDCLDTAEETSKEAINLSNQLLVFAKGEISSRKAIDLNRLIESIVRLRLSRTSNIICKLRLNRDLWQIKGDESQLRRVLDNLVINAKQALSNGGEMEVTTENSVLKENNPYSIAGGKYIKVSIIDSGTGIPKDRLCNLFDPYFTTKINGSGLGLVISHSIIATHNGFIGVESSNMKETKFYFYLPSNEVTISASHEKRHTKNISKGRVLLMDDDESVWKTTGKLIKELGWEIDFAAEGFEAIDVFKRSRSNRKLFDVIIMSLIVEKGMDGIRAAKEILKIDNNTKIILSNSYFSKRKLSKYLKYGFCGILRKPHNAEELSKILRNIENC